MLDNILKIFLAANFRSQIYNCSYKYQKKFLEKIYFLETIKLILLKINFIHNLFLNDNKNNK